MILGVGWEPRIISHIYVHLMTSSSSLLTIHPLQISFYFVFYGSISSLSSSLLFILSTIYLFSWIFIFFEFLFLYVSFWFFQFFFFIMNRMWVTQTKSQITRFTIDSAIHVSIQVTKQFIKQYVSLGEFCGESRFGFYDSYILTTLILIIIKSYLSTIYSIS